jgi:hypothetical protein
MDSLFRAQHLDKEFRGAIQDFGMIRESFGAAQLSNYLHNAGHSVEIPEILFDLSEDIQRAGAKSRLVLLDTHFATYFTAQVSKLAHQLEVRAKSEKLPPD